VLIREVLHGDVFPLTRQDTVDEFRREKSGLATLLGIKVKTNKSLELQHVYAAQTIPPVPGDTAAVARAAFPKGNLYLQIQDTLGNIKTKSLHHYFQTFDSESDSSYGKALGSLAVFRPQKLFYKTCSSH